MPLPTCVWKVLIIWAAQMWRYSLMHWRLNLPVKPTFHSTDASAPHMDPNFTCTCSYWKWHWRITHIRVKTTSRWKSVCIEPIKIEDKQIIKYNHVILLSKECYEKSSSIIYNSQDNRNNPSVQQQRVGVRRCGLSVHTQILLSY